MESSATLQDRQEPAGFALVMGTRQLTGISIVLITIIGTLCSLAYIIGRSVSGPSRHEAGVVLAAPPVVPKPRSPEPAAAPAHPAVPAAAPVSAAVRSLSVAAFVPNALYYQVLSVEPGVARVLAEGLALKGFHTAVIPGATKTVNRVLVGPLEHPSEAKTAKDLEDLGFHPFLFRSR
jgi:hypothetical protein